MRFGSFHISDEFVYFIEEYTPFYKGYTTIFDRVAIISELLLHLEKREKRTYLVYRSYDLAVWGFSLISPLKLNDVRER
jgi:hypothetical protein